MSQRKGVGSKRKALIPNEISVAIKTPKSRKFLFPKESLSSNPRESETEEGTKQVKRSRTKKLRKTQNFLNFVDDTNPENKPIVPDGFTRKKNVSTESLNSESSEVFYESTEKQVSTKKSTKKKMRLPTVVIDDLQGLDDNESYCEEENTHKKRTLRKQPSIDSNSSSAIEGIITEDSEMKPKKKKAFKKSKGNGGEAEMITTETRSSRKAQKQESFDKLDNKSRGSGRLVRNKRSQITNLEFNSEKEESGVNNVDEEEVTITNKCFSSVDEDDEINTQNSGRKTKRKKKSKRSNQKQDEPLEILRTRSSRKGRNEKEDVCDENVEHGKKTSLLNDDSGENIEDNEKLIENNKAFTSVDEDNGTESHSSKVRRKRSKKSNEQCKEDEKPKTRNTRRQKDRKLNDDSEETLKPDDILFNQVNSEENEFNEGERDIISSDVCSTKKHYNSIDEDEEMEVKTSTKKRKRSKKSGNKQNEDEMIATTTRSSRQQKEKRINNDSIENLNLDENEDVLSSVDEEFLPTKKGQSAVFEEIETQTSTKNRKKSRKSDNNHDEDEVTIIKSKSSRLRRNEITEDKSEETNGGSKNQLKDAEEIETEDTLSSVDEGNDMETQSSTKDRRSKRLDNRHGGDETTTNKSRSSKLQKNSISKDESEENEEQQDETITLTRSSRLRREESKENQIENFEEMEFNENVHLSSSVNENYEMKAENSAKKGKKPKKSDQKQVETITSKSKFSRGRKDEMTYDDIEENKQTEELKEIIQSDESEENAESHEVNRDIGGSRRSSRRSYHEKEVEEIQVKKRISEKILKDQNFSQNIETDNETNENKRNSTITKGEIICSTRKSGIILNYDSSGKSEENTEDSEEVEFSSFAIFDDTPGRKRKRSEKSDDGSNEERLKAPKISISTVSQVDNDLNGIYGTGNGNKENDLAKTNVSSISRRSRRTFSPGSTGKLKEAEHKNDLSLSIRSRRTGSPDILEEAEHKNDLSLSRRSRRTFSLGSTDKIKEAKSENNISISRRSRRTFSPGSTDELEEAEHKNDLSLSRRSRRTFSLGSTDKIKEAESENDTSISRKSRRTFSPGSTDELEEAENKNDISLSRRSRRTFSPGSTDKLEEAEHKNDVSLSQSSRSRRTFSPESTDKLEETEHKNDISLSRRSRRTFSTGSTEKLEEAKHKNDVSLSTSRRSRRTFSTGPTDKLEEAKHKNDLSLSTSRRSRRTLSPASTDEEAEHKNDLSLSKSSRSRRTFSPESTDKLEEAEHKNDISLSRRSRRTFSTGSTDKLEEAKHKSDLSLSSSRRSRRTFSPGSTDNQIEETEPRNFSHKRFSFIDKAEEPPLVSDQVSFEPSVQRGKSKGRKRWTIMTDKREILPTFKKIDTPNVSLSVNTSQRRSVRKRWSTELKKKFESMKEENESIIANDGESEEYQLSKREENKIVFGKCSLETSPIPTRKVDFLDSPMPFNVPTFKSISDQLDDTYTPEKSANNSSLRRSKRLSRSLDLSEGISPLEQTITLENETSTLHNDDRGTSSKRMSQTPGSILKRRGTYDVDVSVTDVSILRSLSDSNVSDPEVLFKQDCSENVKKNVRFQHVTVRKGHARKVDPQTPDNKFVPDHLEATNEKKSARKLTSANKSVSFDQTMFSTSSLASSTPLHSLRKNTIMKQTMRRDKLSNVIDRRSRSVETKRDKYVSRIRMPNFTKIHQKAMDRVEDIAEMAKRKAERARLLLSGQKPTAANTSNKTQEKNTIQTKHPKQLKFTTSQQLSNHPANQETSSSNTNKITKTTIPPKIKDIKLQPVGLNKIATNPMKKFEFVKSGLADKLRNVKAKPMQFEGAVKRAEQIKTIATKSKPKTDAREEIRSYVKGVRGNRRFDLLMKMRDTK